MSDVTHTPGPWRSEGPDMFGDHNILHGGEALAIGAVVSNMRPPELVAANARLIAAAPELLEALIAHDTYMLEQGYCGPEDSALHRRAAENWSRIRAAIAKATGRTA